MIKQIVKFISIGVLMTASQMLPICASGDQSTAIIPIEADKATDATVAVTSEDKEALNSVIETVIKFDDSGKAEAIITADEPAEYEYTLSEIPGTSKNVTYDKSTYKAKVFFEAKDDGELQPHVIVWKTGSTTKSDAVRFCNATEIPDEKSNSGTEGTNFFPSLCVLVTGIGLIAYSVHHRKMREKQ